MEILKKILTLFSNIPIVYYSLGIILTNIIIVSFLSINVILIINIILASVLIIGICSKWLLKKIKK